MQKSKVRFNDEPVLNTFICTTWADVLKCGSETVQQVFRSANPLVTIMCDKNILVEWHISLEDTGRLKAIIYELFNIKIQDLYENGRFKHETLQPLYFSLK